MRTTGSAPMKITRRRRVVALLTGLVGSWLAGCFVVIVGLRWADWEGSRAGRYDPTVEYLYLAVAVAALLVWCGGSALAIRRHRRLRSTAGHRLRPGRPVGPSNPRGRIGGSPDCESPRDTKC